MSNHTNKESKLAKPLYFIFFGFLAVRIIFIFITGYDSCQLCPDCYWIDDLSERALKGNFDFDIGRFISAPFYPCFIALHKWILGSYWDTGLVISQLIISSISGVYLFRLAILLFPKNKNTAYLSTGIFAFFPLTLYWVHTFCTEMLFQSLFIISIYYHVFSVKGGNVKYALLSAIIFSFVFLTKSHILLLTPFIAWSYLTTVKPLSRGIICAICYAVVTLSTTLPFGIYNMRKHKEYVLSSNGMEFHFYTGNSDFGYASIVAVPPKNTAEFIKLRNMELGFFNGAFHDSTMALPQLQKQKVYFQYSINWIKEHPEKFLELKAHNLFRFIAPGVSYKQHSFNIWLFSFLISFPIYTFGYLGMIAAIKKDFKSHFYMLGIFISLLFLSVVFYAQNRFRTITIEPFYILYASYGTFLLKEFFVKKEEPTRSSIP